MPHQALVDKDPVVLLFHQPRDLREAVLRGEEDRPAAGPEDPGRLREGLPVEVPARLPHHLRRAAVGRVGRDAPNRAVPEREAAGVAPRHLGGEPQGAQVAPRSYDHRELGVCPEGPEAAERPLHQQGAGPAEGVEEGSAGRRLGQVRQGAGEPREHDPRFEKGAQRRAPRPVGGAVHDGPLPGEVERAALPEDAQGGVGGVEGDPEPPALQHRSQGGERFPGAPDGECPTFHPDFGRCPLQVAETPGGLHLHDPPGIGEAAGQEVPGDFALHFVDGVGPGREEAMPDSEGPEHRLRLRPGEAGVLPGEFNSDADHLLKRWRGRKSGRAGNQRARGPEKECGPTSIPPVAGPGAALSRKRPAACRRSGG